MNDLEILEEYKQVKVAFLYPDGNLEDVSFWTSMISKFPQSFFNDRTPTELSQKWRQISKEVLFFEKLQHGVALEEYKNYIEKQLTPEIVESINKEIAKIKGEEIVIDIHLPKSSQENMKLKSCIDEKEEAEISSVVKRQAENNKGLVFCKETSTNQLHILDFEKDEEDIETYKLLNIKLEDMCKKYNKTFEEIIKILEQVSGDTRELEKYLKGNKIAALWTELEDISLRQPEQSEVYKFLERTKGKDAIKKRKIYFGME